MSVTVENDAMLSLVEPNATVKRLATGFTFTEGPVWNQHGEYLLFSDMPADVRRSWSKEAGIITVRQPSNKCVGMVYDRAGNLVVCEHATSTLVREQTNGKREVLASHFEGKELNGPNDLCIRSDGKIYFTDPTYGRMAGFGVERECELDFSGVYLVDETTGSTTPRLAATREEFGEPNGLCLSPDESLMYVNDTPRAHIKVFDAQPDGGLTNPRIFFDQIGEGVIEDGVVDGMKCDELGNVWVTGPGGVWVIDPQAKLLGIVRVPENVGNLCWGGPGWRTLYLPSSTSLYSIQTTVASTALPYH